MMYIGDVRFGGLEVGHRTNSKSARPSACGARVATGRQRSVLIREAIGRLLAEPVGLDDWKAMLDRTAGAWADRDDLDDMLADGCRSVEERLERLWR
jgi:hypothetical protein